MRMRWIVLFLVLAAVLAGLQIWNAISVQAVVRAAQMAADPAAAKDEVELEAARQELIQRQIEVLSRGEISISLATGLSAAVAALATILGAILALRTYLDARAKEELDRVETKNRDIEAREKERLDRLSTTLNEALKHLVSKEWRERVVGAAGLLPFLTKERADFHLQAVAALIAAARIEDDEPAVRQGVRLAVEQAAKNVAARLLASVSWQGVRLRQIDLSGAPLAGLDLRDAVLDNAVLTNANLADSDLRAATLRGVQLENASLLGARLEYADLAGADLRQATLGRATLSDVKVLNVDLAGADLRDLGAGWRGVPWDATRNWRDAKFDDHVRAELNRRYGASAPAGHVLMLMWELPPMVAGGTWTACYHLVRNLRRRGVQLTVVVPWARRMLQLNPPPFGVEVPVVCLGIELPEENAGDDQAWSPYGGRSSYGSPYGYGPFRWSAYSSSPYGGSRGPYANVYSSYATGSFSTSMLHGLMGEFAERLSRFVADAGVDVIHAHDWVTFDAARAAAERIDRPWIAHFHSTESERQPDRPDPLVQRIEHSAVDNADAVVCVSDVTRRVVVEKYDPKAAKQIHVVPNSLSREPSWTADMGRFETHRAVFLGRLSRQKGVDRFCDVANEIRRRGFTADFVAYGDGPEARLLPQHRIEARGNLPWERRGIAFRGASVLIVPSRFEPFGMVILEAMQHRVPVIYPKTAGAAEVLESGLKVASDDIGAMADGVVRLLGNIAAWEETVQRSSTEVEAYLTRSFEDRLVAIWNAAMTETLPE